MIKAVLFDLDGTLLNRDASVVKFINDQYERLYKWVSHVPKACYTSRFIELDCRGYVWKDKVYQQLVNEFQVTGISWEQLLQDYLEHFRNHCVSFPGLENMLRQLKEQSIRLGVITNGKDAFQRNNITALRIEHYFDTILVSESEGLKKPDPAIFKRALTRLGVTAEQSIYVGDHPANDVAAAQKAGMVGVWRKDAQWDRCNADFTIQDLGELPSLIACKSKE